MLKNQTKIVKKTLAEDILAGKPPLARSPHWDAVRKTHLKNNAVCAACGATTSLQVHHIRPFHLFPELELDPTNLITLCETVIQDADTKNDNHHLELGHNGDFHQFNKNVLKAVNEYRVTKANLGKLTGYNLKTLKKKILKG
jgi:5-methylcytosine-specific restriction protein A